MNYFSNMLKRLLLAIFIINLVVNSAFALIQESKYSQSLSRMEREWLKREFANEEDEIRLSRLEEKVFGTIHDKDKSSRYRQLKQAFDAKKNIQQQGRYYRFGGRPTSIPMNIDGLIGY